MKGGWRREEGRDREKVEGREGEMAIKREDRREGG